MAEKEAQTRVVKELEKAWWSVANGAETLSDCLAEAGHASWQGWALTTTGARAVRLVGSTLQIADEDSSKGQPVKPDLVYELRLWNTEHDTDSPILATEIRWINGYGSRRITIGTAQDKLTDPEPCLLRPSSVMTKDSQGLSVIEVFVVEPQYGNVEYADQIVVGALA